MRIITNSLRCLLRGQEGQWDVAPEWSQKRPGISRGSTKKLIKYLGRYWAAIIAVMIFAAVSTVFSVAGPKVMGKKPPLRLPRDS